ncbi:MAG: 2-oxoisovalerate dehydrogenase E1 subunit beta [Sphaerospermopsis kisseleviana]
MSENRIKEIIFLVEEDDEGSYIAKAVNQSIFTQADSLEELRELIKDAVHCHYPDEQNRPQQFIKY